MAADVDTTRVLDQLEAVLLEGSDPSRCREAIEIARRWQWDGDLNDASRRRAAGLVREFGARRPAGVLLNRGPAAAVRQSTLASR